MEQVIALFKKSAGRHRTLRREVILIAVVYYYELCF